MVDLAQLIEIGDPVGIRKDPHGLRKFLFGIWQIRKYIELLPS